AGARTSGPVPFVATQKIALRKSGIVVTAGYFGTPAFQRMPISSRGCTGSSPCQPRPGKSRRGIAPAPCRGLGCIPGSHARLAAHHAIRHRVDDAINRQLSLGSVLVQQAQAVLVVGFRHGLAVSPSVHEHLHQLLLGGLRTLRSFIVRFASPQALVLSELDLKFHELDLPNLLLARDHSSSSLKKMFSVLLIGSQKQSSIALRLCAFPPDCAPTASQVPPTATAPWDFGGAAPSQSVCNCLGEMSESYPLRPITRPGSAELVETRFPCASRTVLKPSLVRPVIWLR